MKDDWGIDLAFIVLGLATIMTATLIIALDINIQTLVRFIQTW